MPVCDLVVKCGFESQWATCRFNTVLTFFFLKNHTVTTYILSLIRPGIHEEGGCCREKGKLSVEYGFMVLSTWYPRPTSDRSSPRFDSRVQ